MPWDGNVPGICAGTKAAVAPSPVWCLPQDMGKKVRSPAPSPTRAGSAGWHKEGPECFKSMGGIEMKWETHRGGAHPLGLWTPAPEKLKCQATPGEGRGWAMSTLTRIVSGLVENLGCVKTHTLVNGRQLLCKELCNSVWLAPRVISAAHAQRLSG